MLEIIKIGNDSYQQQRLCHSDLFVLITLYRREQNEKNLTLLCKN